jgi:hypothetical protein
MIPFDDPRDTNRQLTATVARPASSGGILSNVAPVVQDTEKKVGFADRVSNFFKDEENVARFIMALEPLRGPVGGGGAAVKYAQNVLDESRKMRLLKSQGSATVAALRKAGHEDLANLVEAEPSLAKIGLAALTQKPSAFSEKVAFYKGIGYSEADAVKAAGAAGGISINTGQDAFATALAKQIPEQISAYAESGKLGRSQNTQLGQLKMMFDRGVPTGRFEDTKNRVRSFAQSLGMPVDESAIADAQTLQAFTSTLVAEELRQNKGPQTDFDARYAQSYMPSLEKEAGANEAILDYMMSRNSLASALGELAAGSRSTDVGQMNTLRNTLDLAATTLGAVVYVDNEPILFAEFLEVGKGQGKSIGQILREWEQLH